MPEIHAGSLDKVLKQNLQIEASLRRQQALAKSNMGGSARRAGSGVVTSIEALSMAKGIAGNKQATNALMQALGLAAAGSIGSITGGIAGGSAAEKILKSTAKGLDKFMAQVGEPTALIKAPYSSIHRRVQGNQMPGSIRPASVPGPRIPGTATIGSIFGAHEGSIQVDPTASGRFRAVEATQFGPKSKSVILAQQAVMRSRRLGVTAGGRGGFGKVKGRNPVGSMGVEMLGSTPLTAAQMKGVQRIEDWLANRGTVNSFLMPLSMQQVGAAAKYMKAAPGRFMGAVMNPLGFAKGAAGTISAGFAAGGMKAVGAGLGVAGGVATAGGAIAMLLSRRATGRAELEAQVVGQKTAVQATKFSYIREVYGVPTVNQIRNFGRKAKSKLAPYAANELYAKANPVETLATMGLDKVSNFFGLGVASNLEGRQTAAEVQAMRLTRARLLSRGPRAIVYRTEDFIGTNEVSNRVLKRISGGGIFGSLKYQAMRAADWTGLTDMIGAEEQLEAEKMATERQEQHAENFQRAQEAWLRNPIKRRFTKEFGQVRRAQLDRELNGFRTAQRY